MFFMYRITRTDGSVFFMHAYDQQQALLVCSYEGEQVARIELA